MVMPLNFNLMGRSNLDVFKYKKKIGNIECALQLINVYEMH